MLFRSRPFAALTRRQVEVLRLIAAGRSNAAIAEARGISVRAAEKAVARTVAALGITDETEGNPRAVAVRRYLESAGAPIGFGHETDEHG